MYFSCLSGKIGYAEDELFGEVELSDAAWAPASRHRATGKQRQQVHGSYALPGRMAKWTPEYRNWGIRVLLSIRKVPQFDFKNCGSRTYSSAFLGSHASL